MNVTELVGNHDKWDSSSTELGRILAWLCVVVIFIIFIVLDACNAYFWTFHWVPSHYLVLSALIIQLFNILSVKSALLEESWKGGQPKESEVLMAKSGRVMFCVVMAYLVPEMAARGSQEFWGKMAALGITIVGHFIVNAGSSFKTFFSPSGKMDLENIASILSGIILAISVTILTLLLGCANYASRGIQIIFAQAIPSILKKSDEENKDDAAKKNKWEDIEVADKKNEVDNDDAGKENKDNAGKENKDDAEKKNNWKDIEVADKKWKRIEDDVLKAWIVARAYHPEYIIAKSPLSTSAAAILSVLILTSIIDLSLHRDTVKSDRTSDILKLTVASLQIIFILIGWAIVAWRCTCRNIK